jgi:hypothetical protein
MDSRVPRPRKELSADGLIAMIRKGFDSVSDPRRGSCGISMGDALMSAFAMFSLKDPSLLAFDKRRRIDPNLQTLYGIGRVPCDTRMREIVDPVDPKEIHSLFTDVFRCVQRGKVLEKFEYWNNCYLLSLDGTQYFASTEIHCPSCQEKHSRNGVVTYSHAAVGVVIVHPDRPEVIPLCPEPIIRQDGGNKNDCERSATRRRLARLRKEHPHLRFIVIEDGLSSNGPHIEDLMEYDMHFILGAKPGDHAFLFEKALEAMEEGRAHDLVTVDPKTGVKRSYTAVTGLALNESHPNLLVNFVICTVEDGDKSTTFSWVTDLPIMPLRKMLPLIERGGRARWKIENETFNTLKNQGYHLEHNYGHGNKNLSTVLMMLMMLAFLVDQTQQIACPLFRAALAKIECRRRLWEQMRELFFAFAFKTMAELYEAILRGHVKLPPRLQPFNSS